MQCSGCYQHLQAVCQSSVVICCLLLIVCCFTISSAVGDGDNDEELDEVTATRQWLLSLTFNDIRAMKVTMRLRGQCSSTANCKRSATQPWNYCAYVCILFVGESRSSLLVFGKKTCKCTTKTHAQGHYMPAQNQHFVYCTVLNRLRRCVRLCAH